MVKEKLNNLKRIFLIYTILILFNLKENSKILLIFILYVQLILINILLGVYNLFGILEKLLELV